MEIIIQTGQRSGKIDLKKNGTPLVNFSGTVLFNEIRDTNHLSNAP